MKVAPMDGATEQRDAVQASSDAPVWSDAPAKPVAVEIVLCIRKLEVQQTHSEVLVMRATLEVYWDDARLIGFSTADGVPPEIWRPQFSACVGLKMPEAEAYKQIPEFYKKEDASDGRLKMHIPMHFGEEGWNLNDDLQRLRVFPFDGARVDLSVVLGGRRRDTNEDVQISLRRANMPGRVEKCGPVQHIDWNAARRSGEYEILAVGLGVSHHYVPTAYKHARHGPDAQRVAFVFSIHVQRACYFYVWKGMVPLYSVAVFAFVTFALEPNEIGDRIGVVAALFLTTYAIQYVTIERLPRLPFATVFDNVCQSVVLSLVLLVIGQCAAYRVARPALGSLDPFDTLLAERVDLAVILSVFAYLLFYSFGFCVLFRVRLAMRTSGARRAWHEGPEQRNRWPVQEAYRLTLDDAFQTRHGKTFLGSGDPVARAESTF